MSASARTIFQNQLAPSGVEADRLLSSLFLLVTLSVCSRHTQSLFPRLLLKRALATQLENDLSDAVARESPPTSYF